MKRIYALSLMTLTITASAQINGFDRDWTFWSDSHPTKQTVSIPHDAMQTEERCDTLSDGRHNGFYPGGVYHYEKTIDVPAEWLQKHVTLQFEGVYQRSKVFINGHEAGGTIYGYTPFVVCADGLLHGGKNIIRVDADNSGGANSRWYTGAGIYRPVHLRIQEPQYIKEVKVCTRSISPAIINVSTDAVIPLEEAVDYAVRTTVLWNGKTVATGKGTNININIHDARLWSADEPNLYHVVVELTKGEKVIDTITQDFGIRQIIWSPKGLFVNGTPTLLRGGCLHHDNGILGACEYDKAAFRKIATMKQYGFNAVRSSHNPCSEALLRACDRLGMYVIDELWDMWYDEKTPFDYAHYWAANHDRDLTAMVNKDFNHPSVLMYSIGNEIKEPAEERGLQTAQKLTDRLHQLDPTRPVTAGINLTLIYITHKGISWSEFFGGGKGDGNEKYYKSSELYNKMASVVGGIMENSVRRPGVDSVTTPVLDRLDIAGYNYASGRYKPDGKLHPNRVIVGAETYHYKLFDNWKSVEQYPWLIGDFMWTAWDYLGEISLGQWYNTDDTPEFIQQYPCLLAGTGAIDLIGHPTGEVFRAKSIWLKDNKPYIAVRPVSTKPVIKAVWRGTNSIPSWSWYGMEGIPATVEVFTSAPKVRLYLNDRLIEEKEVKKNLAIFEVPYEPGVLRAVTADASGNEHEAVLTSAKGKTQIAAQTERTDYHVGDLIHMDIDLTDADGVVESNCDTRLTVQVKGGELLAFGSAHPRTEDRFHTGRYSTYFGRSLAILRATSTGKLIVTISGKGLKTIHKEITITSAIAK